MSRNQTSTIDHVSHHGRGRNCSKGSPNSCAHWGYCKVSRIHRSLLRDFNFPERLTCLAFTRSQNTLILSSLVKVWLLKCTKSWYASNANSLRRPAMEVSRFDSSLRIICSVMLICNIGSPVRRDRSTWRRPYRCQSDDRVLLQTRLRWLLRDSRRRLLAIQYLRAQRTGRCLPTSLEAKYRVTLTWIGVRARW